MYTNLLFNVTLLATNCKKNVYKLFNSNLF